MKLDESGHPILMGPSPGTNMWGVGDITPEWLAGTGELQPSLSARARARTGARAQEHSPARAKAPL